MDRAAVSAFGCQPSCGGGGQFLRAEQDQAAGGLSASLVEEVGKHWRKPCRICRRDDRDAYGVVYLLGGVVMVSSVMNMAPFRLFLVILVIE